MHEASLALSILDTVTRKCSEGGYQIVESIHLRIGRASGVLPEALLFAFNVLKADSIACSSKLIIEHVPVGGTCNCCGETFHTDEYYVIKCPWCGAAELSVTNGFEMDIVEMEVS